MIIKVRDLNRFRAAWSLRDRSQGIYLDYVVSTGIVSDRLKTGTMFIFDLKDDWKWDVELFEHIRNVKRHRGGVPQIKGYDIYIRGCTTEVIQNF